MVELFVFVGRVSDAVVFVVSRHLRYPCLARPAGEPRWKLLENFDLVDA